MPIKLVIGPLNAGKTSLLLNLLQGSLEKRSGLFITPSESSAFEIRKHLLDYLNRQTRKAIIGDVISSWPQFILKLAEVDKPLLSQSQLLFFIFRLMSLHKFRYFRIKQPSPMLAQQFADTIISLKRNGIGHERLRKILNTRGSIKENDLLTLFEKYEEEKSALNFCDAGDLNQIAIQNLLNGKLNIFEGIKTILIDEFYHFEPGQITIIDTLKKVLPNTDIIISFPAAEDKNALFASYLKNSAMEIENLADEVLSLTVKIQEKPKIEVIKTRSMIQEARTAVSLIDTDKPSETVLAAKYSNPLDDYLLEELIKSKLIDEEMGSKAQSHTPLIHTLLSPQITENWKEEAPISEYIELCKNFITNSNIISDCNSELYQISENRILVSRSLAALANLEEILNNLKIISEIFGTSTIGRIGFIQLLSNEVSKRGKTFFSFSHLLPFRKLDFETGLSVAADTVIIPQMLEGVIPCSQSERLFFSEADSLSPDPDPTIDKIFPSTEELLASESYLFETFTAKCRKNLKLIYPIIDEEGSETARSSFLDSFPGSQAAEPIINSCARKNIYHLIQIEEERMCNDHTTKAYHGLIASDLAKDIVRNRFTDRSLSPTGLESYAECPFRFFVEKVLGLKKRDEETPEILPKDRGTIIHAILERFYKNHLADFRSAVFDKKLENKLKKILDRLLNDVCKENSELIKYTADELKSHQKATIMTMAWQVISMELGEARTLKCSLLPQNFEWVFGTNPANFLTIPIKGEAPARIRGCIDRVDADLEKKHFLIVDYKTGANIGAVGNEILKGFHLQLPLYIEAARRFLFPDALPLGGLLLAVQLAEKRHGFVRKEYNEIYYDVGKARSAMNEDMWGKTLDAAISATALYVSSIRQGFFETEPKEKCPRHCDYENVCRYTGKGSD